MSAPEVIEQIKALPPKERAKVAKFVAETDDSWVPESFKQGMADAEAGRFADMETLLSGAKPSPRRYRKSNTASSRRSGFGKASIWRPTRWSGWTSARMTFTKGSCPEFVTPGPRASLRQYIRDRVFFCHTRSEASDLLKARLV
jgi:hypothetical protein